MNQLDTTARGLLIAIADDFQNDYLTYQGYAEANGLFVEDAAALIELAQRVRRTPHPED